MGKSPSLLYNERVVFCFEIAMEASVLPENIKKGQPKALFIHFSEALTKWTLSEPVNRSSS